MAMALLPCPNQMGNSVISYALWMYSRAIPVDSSSGPDRRYTSADIRGRMELSGPWSS